MNPFRVTLFAAMLAMPVYFLGGVAGEALVGMTTDLRALTHSGAMPLDFKWGAAFAALYAGLMAAAWKTAGRIEVETRHNPKALLSRIYMAKLIALAVAMALMTPVGFMYGFAQATAAAFMLTLVIALLLDAALILIGLWRVVVG